MHIGVADDGTLPLPWLRAALPQVQRQSRSHALLLHASVRSVSWNWPALAQDGCANARSRPGTARAADISRPDTLPTRIVVPTCCGFGTTG
jgi:hypothetical protein